MGLSLLEWWLMVVVVVVVVVGVFDGCYICPSISQTVSTNCRTVARALSNFLNLLLWQLELKALNSETASPGDKALHYVCPPSLIEFADLNYLDLMPNIICPDDWMGSTFQPGLVRSRTAPA